MKLNVFAEVGGFAENKDAARRLRVEFIDPAISNKKKMTLDFTGVDLATQSFIHALLSEVIRSRGYEALDLLTFKGCNPNIQNLIEIVASYSQETVDD
ncbi:hypothetical protein BH24ACT5_BH24ACT5_07010 [soil metagenome]